MDYFARGKKLGVEEGKKEREAEQQSMVFSPRAPRGFVLSDLKWRPAVQTWVLWLHIKPFNHRAPCSTKKPLMRSLPRMNKQALMKKPEHFTQAKDTENKRKAEIWAIVTDSWVWIVSWSTSAGGKKTQKTFCFHLICRGSHEWVSVYAGGSVILLMRCLLLILQSGC